MAAVPPDLGTPLHLRSLVLFWNAAALTELSKDGTATLTALRDAVTGDAWLPALPEYDPQRRQGDDRD
jgi:hypothetical protein